MKLLFAGEVPSALLFIWFIKKHISHVAFSSMDGGWGMVRILYLSWIICLHVDSNMMHCFFLKKSSCCAIYLDSSTIVARLVTYHLRIRSPRNGPRGPDLEMWRSSETQCCSKRKRRVGGGGT